MISFLGISHVPEMPRPKKEIIPKRLRGKGENFAAPYNMSDSEMSSDSYMSLALFPDEEVLNLLEHVMPEATHEARLDAWRQYITVEGGVGQATQLLYRMSAVVDSGVEFGAITPPTKAQLTWRDVGLSISLCVQSMYNFYIGRRGKGPESIITDRATERIVVTTPTLYDLEWAECHGLVVRPSTRVRIEEAGETIEIRFPGDPRENVKSFSL
ncbi:hypothetical protein K438DRAFT_2009785 [Mycena galopus ATCC 62051]|nr:hypothetical protein K438DRAFT_2009785 [Mycena galopus ATCC 62051]